jgi:subtilisin family serine protease
MMARSSTATRGFLPIALLALGCLTTSSVALSETREISPAGPVSGSPGLAPTGSGGQLWSRPSKGSLSNRLDSALATLEEAQCQRGAAVAGQFADSAGLEVVGSNVKVTVRPRWGEETGIIDFSRVAELGGVVLARSSHFVDLSVPIDNLTEIAGCDGIAFVQRRVLGVPQMGAHSLGTQPHGSERDPVVSEGVSLTGAAVQHGLGYSGLGMKVAVIDGGFIGLSTAYAAGELGSDAWYLDFTGTGIETTTEHGTAVAENVCDMAPGVTLYLLKIASAADLENAKDFCITEGVDVINHSMGWFGQPGDGTGGICDIAEDAYSNGILWVNSAGNNALCHNEGMFTDVNQNSFHDFYSTDELLTFYLGFGESVTLFLTWDAWPLTYEDYDLYLYDSSITAVSWSLNAQAPGQPVESLTYTAPASGFYHAAILDYSTAQPHEYDLMAMGGSKFHPSDGGEYYVKSGSILSPADAQHAFAVGAMHHADWYTGPVANFSSQGPTNDGRIKPEITGPDSCASSTYVPNWNGTSSASPHVAGAAALIWQEVPAIVNVDDIWDWLTDHAVDMGSPGPDNTYGYGRLDIPPDVPVEEYLYAVATDAGTVVIRWSTGSMAGLQGFRVYRSTAPDGTYRCVNGGLIEPAAEGHFEDTTVWPGCTFWYEVRVVLLDNTEVVLGPKVSATLPGALALALHAPFPNPVRDAVELRFDVPAGSGPVHLSIHDVSGRQVVRPVDGELLSGPQSVRWEPRAEGGARAGSGVYFARLVADGRTLTRKFLVLR